MILALALSILAISAMGEDIQRIDSDGYLYFMDYTGDYYSTSVIDSLKRAGYIEPGWSPSLMFTRIIDTNSPFSLIPSMH